MPVDWKSFNSALLKSRDGHHLAAIESLSVLMSDVDTNSDRAAILLGQASCYSRLGNLTKSRELLESAKMCGVGDREVLSQIELCEGSQLALSKEHEAACEKFAYVKSEYADLLAKPENEDFALELDSRLACSLVDTGKYGEAIRLFRELFKRENLDDKQRLHLFFGVALLRAGIPSEARSHLIQAKAGNPDLAHAASDYLSKI